MGGKYFSFIVASEVTGLCLSSLNSLYVRSEIIDTCSYKRYIVQGICYNARCKINQFNLFAFTKDWYFS